MQIPIVIRVEGGVVTSVETSTQELSNQIQYYIADEDVDHEIPLFNEDEGYILYECCMNDEEDMSELLKKNRLFKSLIVDKNGNLTIDYEDIFNHLVDLKEEFFNNHSKYKKEDVVKLWVDGDEFIGKIKDVYFEYNEDTKDLTIFYIILSSLGQTMIREEDIIV